MTMSDKNVENVTTRWHLLSLKAKIVIMIAVFSMGYIISISVRIAFDLGEESRVLVLLTTTAFSVAINLLIFNTKVDRYKDKTDRMIEKKHD